MKHWMCAALTAGVLAGCAGSKDAQRSDSDGNSATSGPEAIRPAPSGPEKVTEVDVNGDKRPDVWNYTVPERAADGTEHGRRVRQEIDLNWDGRVDLTRYYDERGNVTREAMDLDFDGKVDSVHFYEKGVNVRRERDVNGDGKPDVWTYYEKGKLARKERDANADGRVDTWEYWEGDQVDRIGEDTDGDGNVDRWTKNPNAEP